MSRPADAALPDRYDLAPGLSISRAVTGLWQIADIERKAGELDPEKGADDLFRYVEAGFDTFDMADHYGTAEIVTARFCTASRGNRTARALSRSGAHRRDR